MARYSEKNKFEPHPSPFRNKIFQFIFGRDTEIGKKFDIILIYTIILSVIVVMFDSVIAIRSRYHFELWIVEWIFTIIFSIEYILRIISIKKPLRYIFSFFGLVDFLAVIPTYFSIFITGAESLLIIRMLRLIRIFRVFKLHQYHSEGQVLLYAIKESKNKILVFIFVIFSIASVMGALMYLIEGEENGFTSIPRGVYWSVVTMTTVGYGDIAPKTVLGQMLATILMVMGYGIIAVPTGIFSAQLVNIQNQNKMRICNKCKNNQNDTNAVFCKICGKKL